MLIQATFLLCLAVVSSYAQVPAGLPEAIALPSSCSVPLPIGKRAADDPEDIVRRLNSGELSPEGEDDTATLSGPQRFAPPFRCEDGPKSIIHTVHGEFYWPPIRRGSCDNLYCRNPPCIARKTVWKSACVFVFKIIKGKWVFLGRRLRRYLDHQECGCKNCGDITSRTQCTTTRPCPNSLIRNSFCYWTKKCECCTPFKCPKGQIFNYRTCQCDCPPGSKKNRAGNCVGDCDDINLNFCPTVLCAENDHLKCQVQGYKCVCPSCDDVTATNDCTRTKCLEQRTKPRCKVDPCTRKCRCPNCEDAPDRLWCARTYCGPNNHLQCRWNPYYESCSCPH
ncbi:balbiani ring protein 3-like [Halichondria panicea]|uniref:balbiani ring protein 3-like n=1 Tax=Halichondria panicea TaxID=6063 RepID=UPI00312B7A79